MYGRFTSDLSKRPSIGWVTSNHPLISLMGNLICTVEITSVIEPSKVNRVNVNIITRSDGIVATKIGTKRGCGCWGNLKSRAASITASMNAPNRLLSVQRVEKENEVYFTVSRLNGHRGNCVAIDTFASSPIALSNQSALPAPATN